MPSVDVAIPSYQYGRFLRPCVESILSQDIAHLRVLIIDNASTDDSVEVARELARKDRRIEIVARTRNLGIHASFNEAVDWAEADYFTILCADDLLTPGSLARAVDIMEKHPEVVMAFGRGEALHGDGPPSPSDPVFADLGWKIMQGRELLERFCRTSLCNICGCATLVRTAAQKRVGYYRADLPQTDDFELWMRFSLIGAVAQTRAVQGRIRIHDATRSSVAYHNHVANLVECEAAFRSFFRNEGASLRDARRLQRTVNRSLAARAYWSSLSHLLRRQPGPARELLRFAVTRSPTTAVVPPLEHLFQRGDSLQRIKSALTFGPSAPR